MNTVHVERCRDVRKWHIYFYLLVLLSFVKLQCETFDFYGKILFTKLNRKFSQVLTGHQTPFFLKFQSRSKNEDPEQLKLKQKAKEVRCHLSSPPLFQVTSYLGHFIIHSVV